MKRKQANTGFSLVEIIVALVIISTGLAFLSLLFTQQRLNTINSQVRSNAVIFSQKILDSLRQKDPITLPTLATKQCPPPTGASQADIDLCPTNLNNSNTYSFKANVFFSETVGSCQDTCRNIKVEVLKDGGKIYTVETVYTKFE